MLYEKLINSVMNMLLNGEHEILDVLRKQYDQCILESVENTGVGFYANFKINTNAIKLQEPYSNLVFGDVYGTVNNEFGSVGFILFIRNGYISFLEGYSNKQNDWPDEDCITLSYFDTSKKRNLDNIFKI